MNDWNWMILWVLLTIVLLTVALLLMFVGCVVMMASLLEAFVYGDVYWQQMGYGTLIWLFGIAMFDHVAPSH